MTEVKLGSIVYPEEGHVKAFRSFRIDDTDPLTSGNFQIREANPSEPESGLVANIDDYPGETPFEEVQIRTSVSPERDITDDELLSHIASSILLGVITKARALRILKGAHG